ncbi:hypothetical protein LTS02_013525 [Friedmanniomyces endolithicus]|nr:hypothetical protein LTS02_013525 [Friedmanniomyces endolithicus]
MAVHTVGYRASTGVNYQGHHKTKNGCTQAIKIFCMQQFRLHLRRQSDDATVTRHPTHARRELLALAPEEHRESTLSYEWAILHQSSVWVSSVVNSTMIAALWSAYKLCSVCERDVRRYLLKTQPPICYAQPDLPSRSAKSRIAIMHLRSGILGHPVLLVVALAFNFRLPPPLTAAVHRADRYNRHGRVVVGGNEHAAAAVSAELALHLVLAVGGLVAIDLDLVFRTFREGEVLGKSVSMSSDVRIDVARERVGTKGTTCGEVLGGRTSIGQNVKAPELPSDFRQFGQWHMSWVMSGPCLSLIEYLTLPQRQEPERCFGVPDILRVRERSGRPESRGRETREEVESSYTHPCRRSIAHGVDDSGDEPRGYSGFLHQLQLFSQVRWLAEMRLP